MAKGPAMTPTNRSILAMRDDGWLVDIVERKVTSFLTKDCFGIADLIAIRPGFHPKLVQVTTGAHAMNRVDKILAEPKSVLVLASGLEIEVHGWRYLKKADEGKGAWVPRIIPITFDMFGEV